MLFINSQKFGLLQIGEIYSCRKGVAKFVQVLFYNKDFKKIDIMQQF